MKKTDDDEETAEPPDKPPCRADDAKIGGHDGNEELEWARRHVPQGWSGPHNVFRKTELHDRPPGTGAHRPATAASKPGDRVIEQLTSRLDAIDERLDGIDNRIDQAIERLGKKIRAPEQPWVS